MTPEADVEARIAADPDLALLGSLVTRADLVENLLSDLLLMFAVDNLEAVQRLHDAAAATATDARAGLLIPPAPGLSPAEYWNRREAILADVREKAETAVFGPPERPKPTLACVNGRRLSDA